MPVSRIGPRLRQRLHDDRLIEALRHPHRLQTTDVGEWPELLAKARRTGLLAQIEKLASDVGASAVIPASARRQLVDAKQFARRNQTDIRFEVNRIARALAGLGIDIVLLKGAAYLLAGLPPAAARLSSDLDIMVEKQHLESVEQTLLDKGWVRAEMSDYDDRYYRRWMHELPPVWHPGRLFMIDIHHTIVPPTSRYSISAGRLFEDVVPLGEPRLSVLGRADMVLHSGIHLFTEEFSAALRQLYDLHLLLEESGARDAFWNRLTERADRLGLGRILFYLLRYPNAVFDTTVPAATKAAVSSHAPNAAILAMMDTLVISAISDANTGTRFPSADFAQWCLYVRSHWLKMPPWQLFRHLSRKAWQNFVDGFGRPASVDTRHEPGQIENNP